MKLIKRYTFFLITLAVLIIITIINVKLGIKSIGIIGSSFKEMILVIPPVFILLGLLDVWVPRDTIVKYMGEDSGIVGILLAIIIGSSAAGPLYGAFPVAGVFMKKGVKFSNILIFMGAWSTTKLPMFLFELSAMGTKFAVTRLLIDIPSIIIIAYILNSIVNKKEVEEIYKNAEALT
jgi:uncharacterized membrane protein YraQ (UPF0718 family)